MSISVQTIRTGKKYRVKNYGEIFEFEVLDILPDGNCKVKDLTTLEQYFLYDLTRYGKGSDYELVPLENY